MSPARVLNADAGCENYYPVQQVDEGLSPPACIPLKLNYATFEATVQMCTVPVVFFTGRPRSWEEKKYRCAMPCALTTTSHPLPCAD